MLMGARGAPRFLNERTGCLCRSCVQDFAKTRAEALAAMEQFATMSPKCHQWLHMGDQPPNTSFIAFWASTPALPASRRCSGKLTMLPGVFPNRSVEGYSFPGVDEGANPQGASTWQNEADNRIVCRMAASAHAATFSQRILGAWQAVGGQA
jgi:hypothetical protein